MQSCFIVKTQPLSYENNNNDFDFVFVVGDWFDKIW